MLVCTAVCARELLYVPQCACFACTASPTLQTLGVSNKISLVQRLHNMSEVLVCLSSSVGYVALEGQELRAGQQTAAADVFIIHTLDCMKSLSNTSTKTRATERDRALYVP